MELLLILALFSVGCSGNDNIVPVSHESGLAKYEESKKESNDRRYEDRKQESSYEDDMARIDEEYENYFGPKDLNNENGDRKSGRGLKDLSNDELDKVFGFTGPTANDELDNLERPCALDDRECMRKFFASNGKCKPAYGPVPDPLIQEIYTIFFPSSNLTAAFPGVEIRGLSSAKIREFYVNKKSGNLVFAFDVENFSATVRRAYLRYRRTVKESIILAGFATINFRSATFTTVIPNVPDMQLDQADSHVDVQDGTPIFYISPELAASADPDVITGLPSLVAQLPVSIREGLFFEVQLLSALYIQKNICDFGLKIIST